MTADKSARTTAVTGAPQPGRRRFLAGGAALLGAAATYQLWQPATVQAAEKPLPGDVFSLGVASGDPLPDGVVLWTRLAPDPLAGGGMPA
ncbi:PhoD-like phosphatase N-terminal domain-containing protein, partial [Streptomyces sp. TRM76130]|nr:PhoD-like phosphatase N-terminal domain-containing protein [Streptomyces sp. TRM76130]